MSTNRKMRETHWVLALFLLSLLLGGSAVHAPLNLAIIQAASAPLLLWLAITGVRDREEVPGARLWPVLLLLAWLLLALCQIVPLPPALWRHLPGRETLIAALAVQGTPDRWWPVSLFPVLTRDATLALLGPATIFLAALRFDDRDYRTGLRLVVAVAFLSALVGAAQLLSGDGQWFLYPGGQAGVPSGLFSNRNHQAILMVVALPLLVASAPAGRPHDPRGPETVLTALLAVMLLLTALLTRSRAALLLLPAVILVAAFLFRRGDGPAADRRLWPTLLLLAGGVAAMGMLVTVGWRTLAPRFGGGPDLRLSYLPDLMWTVRAYFPIGSGIGSFIPVFASAESLAIVKPTLVNHAHDEYLQLLIEGGVPALAILAGFLIWLAARGRAILRVAIDRPADRMPRAALIAVILLLVHSIVDYPLRTQALAAVFAFLVAGLARARQAPRPRA